MLQKAHASDAQAWEDTFVQRQDHSQRCCVAAGLRQVRNSLKESLRNLDSSVLTHCAASIDCVIRAAVETLSAG